MKIAHVSSYRPESSNGVFVTVAKLTEHLVSEGDDIEVWHFRRDVLTVHEREEPSGVRVVELPFSALRGLPGHVRYLPKPSRVWIRDRSRDLDGLHFHSVFQPESWYARRLTALPFAITPHGGYDMFLKRSLKNRAKTPLWHLFERDLLRSARFVHAVSPAEAETIAALAPATLVAVVPNGVEVPAAPAAPIKPDAPWLWIGRMHVEKKGLDLLLEGYALAGRDTSVPRLILRGPDFRNGREVVTQLVRRYGLESKVHVGGEVAGREKQDLFESCSLFLHPSRIEGLPLVILEAMSAGRAVAVTPGTNIAGAVEQANAGFLIDAPTPQAVGATLREAACTTTSELTNLGKRARILVERDFSWADTATRIHKLYERQL